MSIFSLKNLRRAAQAGTHNTLVPHPDDTVVIHGDLADYFGTLVYNDRHTNRCLVHYYNDAFNDWSDVWVDSDRVQVIIPEGQ